MPKVPPKPTAEQLRDIDEQVRTLEAMRDYYALQGDPDHFQREATKLREQIARDRAELEHLENLHATSEDRVRKLEVRILTAKQQRRLVKNKRDIEKLTKLVESVNSLKSEIEG